MRLANILFPARCAGCGRIGKYFCGQCRQAIRVIAPGEAICPVCERPAIDGATHPGCRTRYTLDGLTSFFRYDGIIRKAVKTLKYRFVSDLASELVSLIPEKSFSKLSPPSSNLFTLIPVPLHPSRLRERGFNQAEVLGRLIAGKLQIPIRTDILKRTKRTTPQVEMKKKKERLKNMEKVFAVNDGTLTNIIVFDDVFTTGATMRSAANMLKRNGATFVWGMTMAR